MRNLIIAIAISLAATACSWEAPKCASGDCAVDEPGTCSVTDNQNGTFTMTCPDGSVATWADGTDGTDGRPGSDAETPDNGTDGSDGNDGTNGYNMALSITPADTDDCRYNGVIIEAGLDTDRDGVLDNNEIDPDLTVTSCFPAPAAGQGGADGQDGTNGYSIVVRTEDANGAQCSNGGSVVYFGLDTDRDGYLDNGEIDASATIVICNGLNGADGQDGTAPAPAILEICDSVDNDRNDGTQDAIADGIDESIGRVYNLFITSSIEPSEPASRRQLCIWDSATDPRDPDTVTDWVGCAQPGTWNTQGNTQVERWQLGDLFPIQTVMQNFDCAAVQQGVQPGGTLVVNLATPGDGVTCDSFRVVYRNFDGTPSTPACSL